VTQVKRSLIDSRSEKEAIVGRNRGKPERTQVELDSRQRLFPSPGEEPVDAALFERIVREVMARFRPTLEEVVGEIARERLAQQMELARTMLQEVDELSREVRERLEIDRRNEAAAAGSRQTPFSR
jgi:hypothetical protein